MLKFITYPFKRFKAWLLGEIVEELEDLLGGFSKLVVKLDKYADQKDAEVVALEAEIRAKRDQSIVAETKAASARTASEKIGALIS